MSTPVFVSSLAALLAKLRLTGVDGDALAIVNDCLESVRVGLYDALPDGRIDTILLTPYSETATTADQIMRSRGNRAEVTWMRLLLLRRLPVLFMDASDKTQEIWNQEALTREASRDLAAEIARLEAELSDMLSDLLGDEAPSESGINVYTGDPGCVPRPGDTAFGPRHHFGNNIFPGSECPNGEC